MTNKFNAFPQQPENDLRVDTAWRENYSGASMNRKLYGLLPAGIYRGFEITPGEGLTVTIGGAENIALLEVNGFSLTASMPAAITKTLTIATGKPQFITMEATYAIEQPSTVGIFVRDAMPANNAILLARLDLAADATSIVIDDIELAEKPSIGGADIKFATDADLSAGTVGKATDAAQYKALKDLIPEMEGGKLTESSLPNITAAKLPMAADADLPAGTKGKIPDTAQVKGSYFGTFFKGLLAASGFGDFTTTPLNQKDGIYAVARVPLGSSYVCMLPLIKSNDFSVKQIAIESLFDHRIWIHANVLGRGWVTTKLVSASVMVGMVSYFHRSAAIDGWVDLKGGTLNRTTDAALFNYANSSGLMIAQSTKNSDVVQHAAHFGTGDGSTTFTLPNLHLGHFSAPLSMNLTAKIYRG